MTKRFMILFAAIGTILFHTTAEADPLKEGFVQPPDSARPWVYWFIMDGNLSREGITADLEAMEEAGIGGVVIMEVNVGIPRGPVEFMSDEWCQLFKHAVEEAERLGLAITLNAGPGWTGSGGPWVKAEQSMQHLVASVTEATGPVKFDSILPVPEPRPPYFGESGLPEEILQARKDFYVDEAVVAFPRTDGSRITDIDKKALYVREPYTSRPGAKPYLPAPAIHPSLPPGSAIPMSEIVDLTDRLQPDGRLTWDVPAGEWTILRFGRRNTGANTRPAPLPGLGFESDKFDRVALEAHFDTFIGKLLRTVGPRPADRTTGWTMLHIDSWEMGSQNWTEGFGKEFARRRGYDPMPYLPAMTGRVVESIEVSERFLWDLRLTAQELVIENHAGYLKELGRRHGFGLSIEPYDMNPTSDLVLGGVADVPMCEFWSHGYGFDSAFTCFEAASVAHTLGRPIVAAEAFTAGTEEAWKLFPAAMKNQGDWALCTGINRFVFHRFAHQPWLGRRPGMTMGPYGVHWDRTQTWWPMVSAYHRYLARCQLLLRKGATVADICYLVPEGAPHVFRPPTSAFEGELRDRRGHNFDGCAPDVLIEKARVEEGRVVFPSGAAYSLLVLPSVDTMTPELLHKIADLLKSGAVVAGPPPLKSPSLSNFPECDREIQKLAAEIWGESSSLPGVIERRVGLGRVFWGGDLQVAGKDDYAPLYPDYEATARLIVGMGLPPDFESDGPVRYTHRRTDKADFYFVANQIHEPVRAECTFRISGQQPEIWDPLTGAIRDLPQFEEQDGRTVVPLHFEPHQSFFVVFQKERVDDLPSDSTDSNFPDITPVATIEGPWEVSFDTSLGGPGNKRFETLDDWSKHSEAGIKHYSGIVTYRRTFDLPDSIQTAEKGNVFLDLGEVHSMARVRLNGKDLGVVWCAPWRVDIANALQEQGNRLEIEVANLWPNRLIGDKALPPEQQVSWTTWNPYEPDSPLLPSGLLGPVQVLVGK